MAAKRRGTYGVDAPAAVFGIGCGVFACLVAAIVLTVSVGFVPALGLYVIALIMAAQGALYLHATRRGKFLVWDELLDRLALRGDERLLDLGCGRGAVLLAAAARLPAGRAFGVDLWRTADQSGNAEEVTRRNAEAEGVADRVELTTGDLTELPFADNEFDVVVSSLAIHNIRAQEGRAAAVREAVRVLKPGGRVWLADISKTDDYLLAFTEAGMSDINATPLGWRMWWGGPWLATRLITASKPTDPAKPAS